MTLLELADRCEAAKGPDRELDEDILRAGWKTGRRRTDLGPSFTASLDAAMTLVPEGADFTLDRIKGDGLPPCNASLAGFSGNASTPALALCAAALRARAAQ